VSSVGAFVGGELYLSWMHFFQALIALSLFIYIFTTSLDEEDTALAWWPELTALPVAALYTPLGDVEEIFNPLGVSLGASES
jgi:hypothetical protein